MLPRCTSQRIPDIDGIIYHPLDPVAFVPTVFQPTWNNQYIEIVVHERTRGMTREGGGEETHKVTLKETRKEDPSCATPLLGTLNGLMELESLYNAAFWPLL